MRFTIRGILLAVLVLLFGPSDAHSSVSFYFIAHEDDWQLFINPNAYHVVQDKDSKSVFVYVTAGDAGLGVATISPSSVPFYVARETGANAAVRFMADVSTPPEQAFADDVSIRGHSLHRVVYKNTVSYFLRLPDGNGDGSGFSETHHWSLEYFHKGRASSAKAIDGSASYESWRDLVDTVRELIATEFGWLCRSARKYAGVGHSVECKHAPRSSSHVAFGSGGHRDWRLRHSTILPRLHNFIEADQSFARGPANSGRSFCRNSGSRITSRIQEHVG